MWSEILGVSIHFVIVSALHFPFDRQDQNAYRLPTEIIPTKYVLELKPDIYSSKNSSLFTYSGKVTIFLDCRRNTDKIVLHSSDDTEIDEKTSKLQEIKDSGNIPISVEWSRDVEKEFLIANLKQSAFGGRKYQLDIEFSAPLEARATGIYWGNYQNENNETEYFVATNLAPTFARFVFPSFDEPGFKAVFVISILRKDPFHVLSNMPLEASKPREGGWTLDTFKPTVKMSTYTIGIFISKFVSVESKTKSGIINKVWSIPQDKGKLNFFNEFTTKALEVLEDYFGVPFPLPKIDHIAHPSFFYNAMENWGIVMYKSDRLLYEKDHGEPIKLHSKMYTAAHELGHMLFGNLVTMKWWTDLFLKEGFAEFSAVPVLSSTASPDFSNEYYYMFKPRVSRQVDAYNSANPTRFPACGPRSDIIQAYSKYTLYAKGGALNRMFQFALGNETFKAGLKAYLQAFSYEAVDEWALMEKVQEAEKQNGDRDGNFNLNVTQFLGSWLWQPGFPVVTIKDAGTSLIIDQERFLYPGFGEVPEGEDANSTRELRSTRYEVPLLIRHACGETDESKIRTTWLSLESSSIKINKPCSIDQWLIGNAYGRGYYLMNYEKKLWMSIAKQLHKDHNTFTPLERVNILDDAFHMVRLGKLDFNVFMDLVSYIKKERRFLPWRVFLKEIEDLHYVAQSLTTKIGDFIRDMVSECYDELTWAPLTDNVESELRRDVIKAACAHGYKSCLDDVDKIAAKIAAGEDPKLQIKGLDNTIACSFRLNTTEAERTKKIDGFIQLLETEDKSLDDEQKKEFETLICNQNLPVPKTFFSQVFSNASLLDLIPGTILNALLLRVAGHADTTPFLLETLEQNLAVFNESKRSPGVIGSREIVNKVADGIVSEEDRQRFLTLVSLKTMDPNATQNYILKDAMMNVILDRITNNLAWRKFNRDNLIKLDYVVKDGIGRWGSVVDSAPKRTVSVLLISCLFVVKFVLFS